MGEPDRVPAIPLAGGVRAAANAGQAAEPVDEQVH